LQKYIKHSIILFFGLVLINVVATRFNYRWDLTQDKRYTLSETTKDLLAKIDEKLLVKVYLKGDFPLDFKRLQKEVSQHIYELKSYNGNLYTQFINPTGIEEKLIEKGFQPSQLTIEEDGVISETLIFPWAEISYKNKTAKIPLLMDSQSSQEKQLQFSIENLEYAFSKAIASILSEERKTIAILRSNDELGDIYLYDFLTSLKEDYQIAPFLLSKPNENPQRTLNDLQKYDLCVLAKPTKAFSEAEKLMLDQYIMNGGKTLWLIDNTIAEMDSLQQSGEALFVPRDLNLTDLLFSYGVRINYNLVEDLYCSKIAIATGNVGNKTQFDQFLWRHYPLVSPDKTHPITKKISPVNLRFPTNIDTLRNDVTKSVLLESSNLTKLTGLPAIVSLSSIADKTDLESFNSNPQILGVLLEGNFTSAYNHRAQAFDTDFRTKSSPNKMIVISDGDIVANQIQNGQPTPLDSDKWTGQRFGNKDFLLNSVAYLLDDNGILSLRSKSLDIKVLNKEKVVNDKGFVQFVTIALPLLLLALFGFIYSYYRKRKYT